MLISPCAMINSPGSALVGKRPGDKADLIQLWQRNSDKFDSVQRLTQTLKHCIVSNNKLTVVFE